MLYPLDIADEGSTPSSSNQLHRALTTTSTRSSQRSMSFVVVTCAACGASVSKATKEVARSQRLGRSFFCNLSCAAIHRNAATRSVAITAACPHCNTKFDTTTHNKAARFCSRSCASAGSKTEHRVQRAKEQSQRNFVVGPSHASMLPREGWKYTALEQRLQEFGVHFEFEGQIAGCSYVYDLVLADRRLLVEFDGPYHRSPSQRAADAHKEEAALLHGWRVLRVPVAADAIIASDALDDVLTPMCGRADK